MGHVTFPTVNFRKSEELRYRLERGFEGLNCNSTRRELEYAKGRWDGDSPPGSGVILPVNKQV